MVNPRRLGIASIALTALALSACSSGGSDAGETEASSDGPSFVYITNDPIGVNQFLQLGDAGIKLAAEEFGGTSQTFESAGDEQSMRSNIEAALDEAPDAIVLITFDMTTLASEYAEANPEQAFVLIDDCDFEDTPANLYCAVFSEYEGAYLLGVEAGHLSEAGSIGSVGALDIPFIHRYTDSFALGAKSVNPAITDTQAFVGGDNPFADPVRAKELALSVAEGGADHIFAVTAGGNGGVFEAASEAGALSYGVDINQCVQAPGTVVDNVIKAVDVVVVEEVRKILDGEPGGTVEAYGLESGGLSLTSLTEDAASSECVIMDHPDVITAVQEARDGIIDGSIVVPDPVTAG